MTTMFQVISVRVNAAATKVSCLVAQSTLIPDPKEHGKIILK
jgi:hypothetical protein